MTTTIEFITALFCQVDDHLAGLPKHPEAHLGPSGGHLGAAPCPQRRGQPALLSLADTRLSRALFPRLPERTRLFRLFATHQDWTRVFLAAPTVLGASTPIGMS